MYKGLFRLGILTIILSFLLVPGGFGHECGHDGRYEWRQICREDISYTYGIVINYNADDDEVEFVGTVVERVEEYRYYIYDEWHYIVDWDDIGCEHDDHTIDDAHCDLYQILENDVPIITYYSTPWRVRHPL